MSRNESYSIFVKHVKGLQKQGALQEQSTQILLSAADARFFGEEDADQAGQEAYDMLRKMRKADGSQKTIIDQSRKLLGQVKPLHEKPSTRGF